MPKIDIPFAIGETCWHASPDWFKQPETCPYCGGSGKVRVVFHDETTVRATCYSCLRHPGTVYRTVYRYRPTEYVPERIHSWKAGVVDFVPASGTGSIVSSSRLRATEEECAALCSELQAEHEAEEERRALRIAENNHDCEGSAGMQRLQKIRALERDLALLRESVAEEPHAD